MMESETIREVTASLADGKYCIVSTLKEGRLYLAEKAGKRFVLKTASGTTGLELLKREYEIALRLQHPFIASALAWEESTSVGPAIVMEYIRGRSLADYLLEKPSMDARKRIFTQLLEAVGAIHRQSIIHNDIKPENILITEADNDVKLIDFGFADGDAHILEKGLGGTRAYASPELLAHQETDARSDIYSIGRLMQDLFPGRYGRIARKCLQSSPEKRYRTIDELKVAWGKEKKSTRGGLIPAAAAVTGLVVLLSVLSPLAHNFFTIKKYIKNDFARVVRENQLGTELSQEADLIEDQLNHLASEANTEAREGKETMAKAKKLENEIMSRLYSYKRTGDYDYIINIANDGDRCEQLYAKANRLIQKAKPYEVHKDKQIKAFKEAILMVPYYDYLAGKVVLEKVDSVDISHVFQYLVGSPSDKASPSEEQIKELAKSVIINYFIDTPTPTVKAYKYQKADDDWYISLSNGTHYLLRAVKCENGEFEYTYTQAD